MSHPPIEVTIIRCRHEAWKWFARHHYLSSALNHTAKCFLGLIDDRPAAFGAMLPFPHPKLKKTYRLTRTVVMPDFQGIGVSSGFCAALGALCKTLGFELLATTSHPALIAARAASVYWETAQGRKLRKSKKWPTTGAGVQPGRPAQFTASFHYVGPALPPAATAQARLLWHGK